MVVKKREPRLLGTKFKKKDWILPIEKRIGSKTGCEPRIDTIYSVIEEECCRSFRLADNEYGLPYINKEDIEEKGDGIYVVRFRLPDKYEYPLEKVVEYANYRFLSDKHLIYERKEEFGIPFLECVWIINEYELIHDVLEEEFYTKRDFNGRFMFMAKCAANWNKFFNDNCNGKSIVDVARFLNYSEENIMFLECKETDNEAKKEIAKKFTKTINYLKDPQTKDRIGANRTPLEYAKDIIAGWIGEDLFCKNIRENGIEIELNGADKDRVILPSEKVDTKPDVAIRFNGFEWRECELMMEHNGFVHRDGIIVLRHYKYDRLVKNKCLFIDLDFSTGEYVIIDFRKGTPIAKFVEHYDNWGGKPAYVISIVENGIKLRNHTMLIDELKKRLSPQKKSPTTAKKSMVLDVPTKEEEKKALDIAYSKAKEEHSINDNKVENVETQAIGDVDESGDSTPEEEVSSWENEHPELSGWV